MSIDFKIHNKNYSIDISKPLDISIPLKNGPDNPKAWFAPDPSFMPVSTKNFTGEIAKGGPVNFFNVFFNPHGNGTHTECAGHILKDQISVNQCLKKFWFYAQLISVTPENRNGELVIGRHQIADTISNNIEALVIRSIPNNVEKRSMDYSGSSPPYLHYEVMELLVELNIEHLLIDLPSVDKENDGGKLRSHNTFWQTSGNLRKSSTITEFVYVPDNIKDGVYILNLQIAPFELDASPSKPVLYEIRN